MVSMIKVSSLVNARAKSNARLHIIYTGGHTDVIGGVSAPTDTSLVFTVFGANYSCAFEEVCLVKI